MEFLAFFSRLTAHPRIWWNLSWGQHWTPGSVSTEHTVLLVTTAYHKSSIWTDFYCGFLRIFNGKIDGFFVLSRRNLSNFSFVSRWKMLRRGQPLSCRKHFLVVLSFNVAPYSQWKKTCFLHILLYLYTFVILFLMILSLQAVAIKVVFEIAEVVAAVNVKVVVVLIVA